MVTDTRVGPDPTPRWARFVLVALVVFVTYFSAPYRALGQPNELSRLYLTRALVEQHSIDVRAQVQRYGFIHDLSAANQRPYSDKAPGSSVLALVAYAPARALAAPAPLDNLTLARVARSLLLAPISLLASLLVLPRVLRRAGVSDRATWIAVVALAVGSVWLTYSTLYFGHVLAGALLLVALDALLRARQRPAGSRTMRLSLLAGMAAGAAGTMEYPAILAASALLAFCLGVLGRRSALVMLAGAAPFAVALLAYHQIAFGTPFTLPYRHLAWPEMMKYHERGIAGVAWPSIEGLIGVLFGRARGLLVWAPFALLAPWGAVLLWRRVRALSAAVTAVVGLYLLVVVGSSVWHGGWSLGPRLLVPALPFATLLSAVALDEVLAKRPELLPLVLAPVLYGIAVVPTATAIFPGLSIQVASPLADAHVPLAACGVLPENLGHALGLDGTASLLPLAAALVGIGAIVVFVAARSPSHRVFVALSVLAAASGVLLAARGARMTATERRDLMRWASTLEREEPHRLGKGVRDCEPSRRR